MPHLFPRASGHQRKFSKSRVCAREAAIKLNEMEANDLKYLLENVSDQSMPARINWISSRLICQYDSEKIYKYCENSEIYKKVCEDGKAPHISAWAAKLEAAPGNIYTKMIASDGTEISVYDLYVDNHIQYMYDKEQEKFDKAMAIYQAQIKKSPKSKNPPERPDPSSYLFWLEEGCRHKALWALRAGCEEEIFNIQNSKSEVEEHAYSDKFEANLVVLKKFYGTMGYLCAARLCNDMAVHFEAEKCPEMALKYYNMAAGNFFCGVYLLNKQLPEDLELIKILSPASGLKVFGFGSLESAENQMLSKIVSLSIQLLGSEDTVSEAVAKDEIINEREKQMLVQMKELFVDNAAPIIDKEIELRAARKAADTQVPEIDDGLSKESSDFKQDSVYSR